MAEQFHLHAADNKQAKEIESFLNSFIMDSDEYFHVGTNKVFLVSVEDSIVHVQCRCTKDVRSDAKFFSGSESFEFYNYFYKMKDTKSGKHNQRGLYWTRGLNFKEAISRTVPPSQIHKDIIEYFAD